MILAREFLCVLEGIDQSGTRNNSIWSAAKLAISIDAAQCIIFHPRVFMVRSEAVNIELIKAEKQAARLPPTLSPFFVRGREQKRRRRVAIKTPQGPKQLIKREENGMDFKLTPRRAKVVLLIHSSLLCLWIHFI